ncbi:MAG: ATP-binding protein [Armatimonadota bacterium]|nr:ATP-binding protein [Armatimonadota bacterium]
MENKVANLGDVVGQIQVQIGPQLLEVFSEQLYSSPNKAFEELVSNSWDAGANAVYIGFPDDEIAAGDGGKNRTLENAIWVLDDGVSMNDDGLQELWTIAYSHKRKRPWIKQRTPIGKFGVGKLATYLLANSIVYFCKASDGIIRCVEVDYASLIADSPERLTSKQPTSLDVLTLTERQMREILQRYEQGGKILSLITDGVTQPTQEQERQEDEYGGEPLPTPEPSTTWTLVLLTSLKEPGLRLQTRRIRWMLRASLPLSPVMTITMNEEMLLSSKIDEQVDVDWQIGPELELNEVSVSGNREREVETYAVTPGLTPFAHICIEGIEGCTSGRVKLYGDKISGGKSELEGVSHGFFVNILGRVINLNENYFGLKNLSHGVWSRFRATVRADWLDAHLSVDREGLQESPEVRAFRGLLLAFFNKARLEYDESIKAGMPNAGDILTQHFGSLPLRPLRQAVSEGLKSKLGVAPYITIPTGTDLAKLAVDWETAVAAMPSRVVGDVIMEKRGQDAPLVTYSPGDQVVYVNEEHPFSREHATSRELKQLLSYSALADLMMFAFMSDLGIGDANIRQILDYKDGTLRLLAKLRRRGCTACGTAAREQGPREGLGEGIGRGI